MNRYLFAFDLDGTLLSPDKTISKANIKALKEISEAGHRIVIASGRLGSSIMKYRDVIDVPFSTITLNGAAAYSGGADTDSSIFKIPLPNEYASNLIAFSKKTQNESNFILNFYNSDKLFTDSQNINSKWRELYYTETKSVYNYVDNISSMFDGEPEKILLVGDEFALDKIERYYRNLWKGEVYIVRTWEYYLEFLNKNVNKGAALKLLCKKFNTPLSSCIAFGDGDNDAELLSVAGKGIAVNNASEKAKAAADKTSSWSNEKDAIANEWKLIKKR